MKQMLSRFATDYSMLFVLLLLGLFFSLMTIDAQHPTGKEAAEEVADQILSRGSLNSQVLIVAGTSADDVS